MTRSSLEICLWGSSRRGCHRLFSGVRSSLSFKGRIQTEACVIPNYHGMIGCFKVRLNVELCSDWLFISIAHKAGKKLGMTRYHFFRTDTDSIPTILSMCRYRYRYDTSTVFLNQCRISISQCVLTYSLLFCVLHTIY